MNIQSTLKSLSNLEVSILVIFAFYLATPVQTPEMLTPFVDAPLSMLGMFILAIYLFFNANPLVAILYIFVAYELLRRTSNITGRAELVRYTPSQIKKDAQMKAMNPTKARSLEEDVVEQMAPVGHSDVSVYTTTSFKPVAEKIGTASMY